jgi:hypothetical protein
MTETAFQLSSGTSPEVNDFNENYRHLKKLIQALRVENGNSIKRELFGEDERERSLSKKEIKSLFRSLRKLEQHYTECFTPPIPEELEQSIRMRDNSKWLPWEMEAIEKVEAWRAALSERKLQARRMFEGTIEKVRNGKS